LAGPIAVTTQGSPFSPATIGNGTVGLWLDRQSGVLAYAPLYWLVPPCAWLARRTTWPWLVPALLLFAPAASFSIGWWAGFSPAGRYLVPMIPLCAVAAAAAWRHRPVRVAAFALLVPQVVLDAVVWQWPRTLWATDAGNAALDRLGPFGRAYEAVLPPVRLEGVTLRAVGVIVAWAAVSALVVRVSARGEGEAGQARSSSSGDRSWSAGPRGAVGGR
jgi:hypothetical protein